MQRPRIPLLQCSCRTFQRHGPITQDMNKARIQKSRNLGWHKCHVTKKKVVHVTIKQWRCKLHLEPENRNARLIAITLDQTFRLEVSKCQTTICSTNTLSVHKGHSAGRWWSWEEWQGLIQITLWFPPSIYKSQTILRTCLQHFRLRLLSWSSQKS